MRKLCLAFFVFAYIFVISPEQTCAAGKACGNGVCQASQDETCSSCPQDCGICSNPTPTPNPTPNPTTTPAPTSTSQPSPGQTSTPGPSSSTDPSSTSSPSGASSSSSSVASVIYYPSINFLSTPTTPTNTTTLSFNGQVGIENGTVNSVEYSTDGVIWSSVPIAANSFAFLVTVPEGTHTILARAKSVAGVYTQDTLYAKYTVTIITTPPIVTLEADFESPTQNQTPTISGRATSAGSIARVEISLDSGSSWKTAKINGENFSFVSEELEDGNYSIVARAFDNVGNVGQSETRVLVVDTLPPIRGGLSFSVGPQILTPNNNGTFTLATGVKANIALSMKGGPISTQIESDGKVFTLTKIEGTNIWQGEVLFETQGTKVLKLIAKDGAENAIDEETIKVHLLPGGNTLPDTKIYVYFFDSLSQNWVLWDAEAYSQKNPVQVNREGKYSFLLPAGKYYLEGQHTGYWISQSEIFSLSDPTVITSDIPMRKTLPLPAALLSLLPPKSFPINLQTTQDQESTPPNRDMSGDLDNQIFAGKTFVSFVSTWSLLSQEQMSVLNKISQSGYKDKMLVVFLQDSQLSAQSFIKRGNYNFEFYSDNNGGLGKSFNVGALPQHFIINNGKIEKSINKVLLDDEIVNLLK